MLLTVIISSYVVTIILLHMSLRNAVKQIASPDVWIKWVAGNWYLSRCFVSYMLCPPDQQPLPPLAGVCRPPAPNWARLQPPLCSRHHHGLSPLLSLLHHLRPALLLHAGGYHGWGWQVMLGVLCLASGGAVWERALGGRTGGVRWARVSKRKTYLCSFQTAFFHSLFTHYFFVFIVYIIRPLLTPLPPPQVFVQPPWRLLPVPAPHCLLPPPPSTTAHAIRLVSTRTLAVTPVHGLFERRPIRAQQGRCTFKY